MPHPLRTTRLRRRRALLLAASIALLPPLLTLGVIVSHYADRASAPADCAVVFGAAVHGDRPSAVLADRVLEGVRLVRRGLTPHCLILSGGPSPGSAPHEVTVMTRLAIANGISPAIIYRDRRGTSTAATLRNLAPHRRYILVSSGFHLARIAFLARFLVPAHVSLHAAPHRTGILYRKEPFFVLREIAAIWYYGLALLYKTLH